MRITRLFLTVLFVVQVLCAAGQSNNFRTYGIQEGLSRSNVFSLLQDKRGFIWAGTDGGGVNRFDGITFKTYNTKNGLTGNSVRCMMEDSKGRIWFGTDEGITIYDGKKFSSITASDSLKGSNVISLYEDSRGVFWAGTDDGGLNKIDLAAKPRVVATIDDGSGLTNNSVFDILEDGFGRLWLATIQGGINILDQSGGDMNFIALRGGDEIPTSMILSLEDGGDGSIWVGTYDQGAFRVTPDQGFPSEWDVMTYYELSSTAVWDISKTTGGEIWLATGDAGVIRVFSTEEGSGKIRFANYTADEGLASNQLLALLEDYEGNIWMGTNGDGLIKFMGDRFAHYYDKDGLSSNKVMDIEVVGDSAFWLATDGGGITYFMEGANGELQSVSFGMAEGLHSEYISCVTQGNTEYNSSLWYGTTHEGIGRFHGDSVTVYTEDDGLHEDRVNDIHVDRNGIVWIATATGITRWDGSRFIGFSMEDMAVEDEGVNCILEGNSGNIWFGTVGALARYDRDGTLQTYDYEEGLDNANINALAQDKDGNIWIGTNGGGLYFFDMSSEDEKPIRLVADDQILSSNAIYSLGFIRDEVLVVGTDQGFDRLAISLNKPGDIRSSKSYDASDGFIGVECNIGAAAVSKGRMWLGTSNGLTRYAFGSERKKTNKPIVHITDVKLFFKDVDWQKEAGASVSAWFNTPKNLELPHNKDHLTFHFKAISLTNPDKIRYQYKLIGRDKHWSPADVESKVTYSGLKPGSYTFVVRAQDVNGEWSEEKRFSFEISPPWYQTTWFYISCGVLAILLFFGYTKFRERKLKREKEVLEQEVQNRTVEIRQQRDEIEEKNNEILDSINYANRIQEAMLPREEDMSRLFSDSFVLFRPKDIVSGDFYWLSKVDNRIYFTASDCTGHGVPGAFMSMIGNSILNEVINNKRIVQPNEILFSLRENIIQALKQTGAPGEQKDGMDMALCMFDPGTRQLQFAGANNPLYLIRKGDRPVETTEGGQLEPKKVDDEGRHLYVIKGNNMPVSIHSEMLPYNNHTLQTEEGDCIYVFSDGFADQFGGPRGKKLKYGTFQNMLLELHETPMLEQEQKLQERFLDWMGEMEQIDDVCVIGVRV